MKFFSPPFSQQLFQSVYGAPPRLIGEPLIAAPLGDSISAQNSTTTSYSATGYLTQLVIQTGRKFRFPLNYNFGWIGDTLAQIRTRSLPGALASDAAVIFFLGGTNNDKTQGATSIATMKADASSIMAQILLRRKIPVTLTLPPDSSLTANGQLVRATHNNWLIDLGLGRPDLVAAAGLPCAPIVSDINRYIADPATGAWKSGMSDDGKHPNAMGAYFMAKAIREDLEKVLVSHSYRPRRDYLDDYHATHNPTGSLLSGHSWTFEGVGGTKTMPGGGSTLITGDVPTGWDVAPGAPADSTTNIVCSKPDANTLKLVFSASGAGGSINQYKVSQLGIGFGGDLSAGDRVFSEFAYDIISCNKLQTIMLLCQEVGSVSNQSFYDGHSVLAGLIPEPHSGVLRTDYLTLAPGSDQVRQYLFFHFDTTGGDHAGEINLTLPQTRKA
ncbi:MAG: SGNH/GDSL hydrolase family protein [Reyranella sp.]|uniref:SGNH/GDSL hydrolase family protein n=1 Tax=Reyranella sp. TaxID=1929291 RepID=UPI00121287D3|nr:SGNH/GDSL hydrolase family protein [Reyranella sp.]TAJ96998.1 MAG: SGNH/GDSL hydrolase family protein [Reyranella sp.]TBR22712.1 MAG: SGNH/GDSL hydrolase family protein [Reyranella sp.]